MKLCNIVPIDFIDHRICDFQLVLSHLIDLDCVNEYEQKMIDTCQDIYLDNGTFENGEPERCEILLKKAIKLKAKYVFCPDYLYDSKATYDAFQQCVKMKNKMETSAKSCNDIELYNTIKNLKLAVVIQANDINEYIHEYLRYNKHDEVSLIGLSILSIPHCWKLPISESRIECMKALKKLSIPHKDCHMLGLGDNYQDVFFAINNCEWIKSNDTSCCFQSAIFKKVLTYETFSVPGGKVKPKIDFKLKSKDLSISIKKVFLQNVFSVMSQVGKLNAFKQLCMKSQHEKEYIKSQICGVN